MTAVSIQLIRTYYPGNYDLHTIKSANIVIYGEFSLFVVRTMFAGVIIYAESQESLAQFIFFTATKSI
jgi:hypothetical protein